MPHFGIPLEFVLFGLTLVGIAVFHHRTLRVSLIGLTAITLYKLFVTGFNTGPGVLGLFAHFSHEWVILCNLLLLLTGFALLADHFESSKLATSRSITKLWTIAVQRCSELPSAVSVERGEKWNCAALRKGNETATFAIQNQASHLTSNPAEGGFGSSGGKTRQNYCV